jgi:methyl-accepting chemotaxis protein
MSLENFVSELESMGFSQEVREEFLEALSDLYIGVRIPYMIIPKGPGGIYYSPIRTKYWPYSDIVEKVLLQYGLVDTSSAFTVYTPEANWYFLALTEKGVAVAQEAYMSKLEKSLDFVKDHLQRYKRLAPILYYGAIYDESFGRIYFNSKPIESIDRVLRFETTSILDAKIGKAPEPPQKRRTPHTVDELWGKVKDIYGMQSLDMVRVAYMATAQTQTITNVINEFFSPLYERRLVLLIPPYSSRNVYTDWEKWYVTSEFMDVVKESNVGIGQEKLKEFVTEFVSLFLLYLGSKHYTKGEILKALEVILDENKELGLSYYEVLERLRELIQEISSSTGSISGFNEYSEPESPPFMVMNGERLDKAMMEYLELIGSRALSLSM